jgi:hypothetical protein
MGAASANTDLRADVFIGAYLNFERGAGTFSAATRLWRRRARRGARLESSCGV